MFDPNHKSQSICEVQHNFENQIAMLESELKQSKDIVQDLHDLIESSDYEKSNMAKRFECIVKENTDLNALIDEKIKQIKQILRDRDTYKTDAQFYKERYNQMEINSRKYKNMYDELIPEKDLINEQYINLQAKFKNLEQELATAHQNQADSLLELENLKREQEQVD